LEGCILLRTDQNGSIGLTTAGEQMGADVLAMGYLKYH
jgi:hypothetical protein